MAAGTSVDVLYLDFAKVFDKVPTKRLLGKLHTNGVWGRLLAWIRSWLSELLQRVLLNGEFTEWLEVLSGVPPGECVGPSALHHLHKRPGHGGSHCRPP